MRLLGFLGGANATYDALVGFAWPGGAVGVSFPFARQCAGESATRFASLLAILKAAGATIDLNTHRLGAHVEALSDSPAQTVRNTWNFVSAVDNESIENGERYFQATALATSSTCFTRSTILSFASGTGSATCSTRHGTRVLRSGRSR